MDEQNVVSMTAEERQAWERYKEEMVRMAAADKRKQLREEYAQLVDDELEQAIGELRSLSDQIRAVKDAVFGNFRAVLDMKAEIIGLKEGDSSRTRLLTHGARCA